MGNCCNNKDDNEVTDVSTSFKEFEVANRWKLIRFIGNGSYGSIYEVLDLNSSGMNDLYAMKVENIRKNSHGEMTGRLPHEAQIIGDIRKRGHIRHLVEIIDRGPLPENFHHSKPTQFIVMTLLGPSLVDLAEFLPKKAFSSTTMALIGKQAIEVIQTIHDCGYLHRDIKPANFVVGLHSNKHEIYLIDFGLARKYVDKNGKILPPRPNAPFRGTAPYVSYNAFNNREQAPKDDLWALFYTLIDLRTGNLPWARIVRSSEANDLKIHISPHLWLKNVEPEYMTFYEFLTSLYYDIFPNYEYLNSIFYDMMKHLNVTPDSPMDWELGGYHYKKFKKSQLAKMFRE